MKKIELTRLEMQIQRLESEQYEVSCKQMTEFHKNGYSEKFRHHEHYAAHLALNINLLKK